jgi:solute:Na+ symporter, SSS family
MLAITSFVFFTGLVGLLTYLLTRGKPTETAVGYFLAGRSLTFGVVAGSLLLTNLSTEQLVGLNGAAFADGLVVMAWEVIAGVSLVMLAIFFLPRYLAKGIATVPEFLAGRFNDTTRLLTNFIFVAAYTLLLLPIILYTGATGLIDILDLQTLTQMNRMTLLWGSVWMIGILGSIYAIFGGLRSVAVSDTLNGFGLLTGGVLIAYLALQRVGDGDVLGGLVTLRDAHPEKFRSLGGDDTSVPWHTLMTGVLLLNMFYWTTNQQIIQRTFAAKSLAEGQKGVLLAACFKIMAPLILVLPGIVAFHLDSRGELFNPLQLAAFREQVDVAYERQMVTDPQSLAGVSEENWKAQRFFETKKDKGYGTLVSAVLPWWLTGFFAAAIVGAILSSFNSVLNSVVTLVSLDAYRKFIRPHASEQQTVRVGRIFGTTVAIAAMLIAPLLAGQDSIFGYLQKMNGLYAAPIFAVVLVGMFTRRVPAIAANIALVLGVATIAFVYFAPTLAGPLATIPGFHFLGLVFVCLVALMLAIGAFAPRAVAAPAPDAPDHSEAVDIPYTSEYAVPMEPWPGTIPAGIALVTIVLGIYAWFAF